MGRYNREKKAHQNRTKRSEMMRSHEPAIMAARRETITSFNGPSRLEQKNFVCILSSRIVTVVTGPDRKANSVSED